MAERFDINSNGSGAELGDTEHGTEEADPFQLRQDPWAQGSGGVRGAPAAAATGPMPGAPTAPQTGVMAGQQPLMLAQTNGGHQPHWQRGLEAGLARSIPTDFDGKEYRTAITADD